MPEPFDRSVLRIDIPAYVDELVEAHKGKLERPEARMALAVALSRANVERGGSPFGAVICAGDEVIAAGVNLVLSSGFSLMHAEIVTMLRAQQVLASGATHARPFTMYTSAEPCCQCFGALIWSGLDALVCGACTADVEAIGFNEGPKPQPWNVELERHGIRVQEGVGRAEAVAVLEQYKQRGGPIYGSKKPAP